MSDSPPISELPPTKKFQGKRFISSTSHYIGPTPWSSSPINPPNIMEQKLMAEQKPLNSMVYTPVPVPKYPLDGIFKTLRSRKFIFYILMLFTIIFSTKYQVYTRLPPMILCSLSRLLCFFDRTFLSASWDPTCKFALLAHTGTTNNDVIPPALSLNWAFHSYTYPFNYPRLSVGHIDSNLEQWAPPSSSHFTNFASIDVGATIAPQFTSPTYGLPAVSLTDGLKSMITGYYHPHLDIPSPYSILEDSMTRGECWRTAGSSGHVGIVFSTNVSISHIAVDHIFPLKIDTEDLASAPRKMSLWALVNQNHNKANFTGYGQEVVSAREFFTHKMKPSMPIFWTRSSRLPDTCTGHFVKIADILYDLSLPTTRQVFPVQSSGLNPTSTVVLRIESNQGGSTTCLYSVAIYGRQEVDVFE